MAEPERSFNWWELLGAGLGTGVGGGLGFLVGGPAGAKVGAGLGYAAGTGISPGGYWNTEQPTAQPLRGVDSAGITAAAMQEMDAARRVMARRTADDITAMRPQFAQRGAFQSGARERTERGIRENYAGRLADALAGISLESQGLQQQGRGLDMQMALSETQLGINKQMMENQMIDSVLEVGLPFALERLFPQEEKTPELDWMRMFMGGQQQQSLSKPTLDPLEELSLTRLQFAGYLNQEGR